MKTWQGDTLKDLPMGELAQRLGAPTICVARRRFNSALKERLPEGSELIRAPFDGTRMQGEKVQIASPPGEAEYDLLVIADGQRRRNRSLMVPSWQLQYPAESPFMNWQEWQTWRSHRNRHFSRYKRSTGRSCDQPMRPDPGMIAARAGALVVDGMADTL